MSQSLDLRNILYEKDGRVGVLTINRPDVKNAIDIDTMEELERLLDHLERDREMEALILTGAGEDAFVAGGDLKYFQSLDTIYKGRDMSLQMQHILNRLERLDIPVIAALNGYAFGGGCEVMVACDIRICDESVQMGFRQVAFGIMCGWGGANRLLRIVGRSRALMLLLTGDVIDAHRAFDLGLVDIVVPKGQAVEAARAMAHRIAENAPLSVRFTKRALHVGKDMPLSASIDYEAELFCTLWASADHDEAVEAFFAKRKPDFKGH